MPLGLSTTALKNKLIYFVNFCNFPHVLKNDFYIFVLSTLDNAGGV